MVAERLKGRCCSSKPVRKTSLLWEIESCWGWATSEVAGDEEAAAGGENSGSDGFCGGLWWLFSAGMKSGGSVRCYRGGIWLESGVSSWILWLVKLVQRFFSFLRFFPPSLFSPLCFPLSFWLEQVTPTYRRWGRCMFFFSSLFEGEMSH